MYIIYCVPERGGFEEFGNIIKNVVSAVKQPATNKCDHE